MFVSDIVTPGWSKQFASLNSLYASIEVPPPAHLRPNEADRGLRELVAAAKERRHARDWFRAYALHHRFVFLVDMRARDLRMSPSALAEFQRLLPAFKNYCETHIATVLAYFEQKAAPAAPPVTQAPAAPPAPAARTPTAPAPQPRPLMVKPEEDEWAQPNEQDEEQQYREMERVKVARIGHWLQTSYLEGSRPKNAPAQSVRSLAVSRAHRGPDDIAPAGEFDEPPAPQRPLFDVDPASEQWRRMHGLTYAYARFGEQGLYMGSAAPFEEDGFRSLKKKTLKGWSSLTGKLATLFSPKSGWAPGLPYGSLPLPSPHRTDHLPSPAGRTEEPPRPRAGPARAAAPHVRRQSLPNMEGGPAHDVGSAASGSSGIYGPPPAYPAAAAAAQPDHDSTRTLPRGSWQDETERRLRASKSAGQLAGSRPADDPVPPLPPLDGLRSRRASQPESPGRERSFGRGGSYIRDDAAGSKKRYALPAGHLDALVVPTPAGSFVTSKPSPRLARRSRSLSHLASDDSRADRSERSERADADPAYAEADVPPPVPHLAIDTHRRSVHPKRYHSSGELLESSRSATPRLDDMADLSARYESMLSRQDSRLSRPESTRTPHTPHTRTPHSPLSPGSLESPATPGVLKQQWLDTEEGRRVRAEIDAEQAAARQRRLSTDQWRRQRAEEQRQALTAQTHTTQSELDALRLRWAAEDKAVAAQVSESLLMSDIEASVEAKERAARTAAERQELAAGQEAWLAKREQIIQQELALHHRSESWRLEQSAFGRAAPAAAPAAEPASPASPAAQPTVLTMRPALTASPRELRSPASSMDSDGPAREEPLSVLDHAVTPALQFIQAMDDGAPPAKPPAGPKHRKAHDPALASPLRKSYMLASSDSDSPPLRPTRGQSPLAEPAGRPRTDSAYDQGGLLGLGSTADRPLGLSSSADRTPKPARAAAPPVAEPQSPPQPARPVQMVSVGTSVSPQRTSLHPQCIEPPAPRGGRPQRGLEGYTNLYHRPNPNLRQIMVPDRLIFEFAEKASRQTARNQETAGILAGIVRPFHLLVTTIIMPPQHGTADACVTSQEERVLEVLHQQGLVALGWIHTHPSQTAFLSSIDMHTQFSYQALLPEAIAIVLSPTKCPDMMFFQLSTAGMKEIHACRHSSASHHPHESHCTVALGGEDSHVRLVHLQEGEGGPEDVGVLDMRDSA